MGLFKKNPFGHYQFLKKWLIRIFGVLTHRRYRGYNELQIEGSEIIKNLPDTNVLSVVGVDISFYLLPFCSPGSFHSDRSGISHDPG